MKGLIVTADDVGLHEGMTLGAIRAHLDGIVTACSVVANGRALDHAIGLLRDCRALDVGVHLTLVDVEPVSPPARVRSLLAAPVDMPGSAGGRRFLSNYRQFLGRYALGRVSLREIELELRAQTERILGTGLEPTVLNSHQHLHLLPGIFEIVLRLARDYRIGYVRIVDDRGPAGAGPIRRSAVSLLGRLGRRARSRAAAARVRTNDATIGVACAGRLDVTRLLNLLPHVEGLTELITHPGVDTATIARSHAWNYDWDGETAALRSAEVRASIGRAQIELRGTK